MAAKPIMMLGLNAPLRRPLENTVHSQERSGCRRCDAGCTLIEHHNPLRYCYLQVCCSCCPGLANLAPHVEAFQSNSMRRAVIAGHMTALTTEAVAVIEGRHADPFRYLGPHVEAGAPVVRVLLPGASEVKAFGNRGDDYPLTRIHEAGLFVGRRPDDAGAYRLRARFGESDCRAGGPVSFSAGAVRSRSASSGRGHASSALR